MVTEREMERGYIVELDLVIMEHDSRGSREPGKYIWAPGVIDTVPANGVWFQAQADLMNYMSTTYEGGNGHQFLEEWWRVMNHLNYHVLEKLVENEARR